MRLDHLLSKDRSKGCVSGKLSCVKNPAPREMEDIGRGTGSPEDGSHLPGRTRREAPLDGISPKCGAFRDCAEQTMLRAGRRDVERKRNGAYDRSAAAAKPRSVVSQKYGGGDALTGNTRSHPEHDR